MLKKILIYIILFSFLHLVGCYSTAIMPPEQYQEIMEVSRKAEDIIINLRNGERYKFARGYYHISNDSLIGEGFEIKYESEGPYEATKIFIPNKVKIPLSQIKSIQFEEYDSEKTFALVFGIITAGGFIYYMITISEADFRIFGTN